MAIKIAKICPAKPCHLFFRGCLNKLYVALHNNFILIRIFFVVINEKIFKYYICICKIYILYDLNIGNIFLYIDSLTCHFI